ncbi:MAG: thiolase family protein [Patulibacter sp.]|nr:thiolase family protein [Patulibacter sp.]
MNQWQGRDVVIVDAVRTPIGKGNAKGVYRDVHPADLLGRTLEGLIARSGVDPTAVEHVVAGCVQQYAEQTLNIARTAWLQQGLPIEASATTLDHQCGSSQQGIAMAVAMVASGLHDVVIGGGVEHMGHVSFAVAEAIQEQHGRALSPEFLDRHDVRGQGIGAELLARKWDLTRADVDELAVRSHRRAAAATSAGRFDREILPLTVDGSTVDRDQGIRPDTDLDGLGGLRTVFDPQGLVTAGNASQISDGASAVLIATRERAEQLGLAIRARVVDHVSVGCDPVIMLEGPLPATHRILERNGITIDDIDVTEINEAFAPVVAAWLREHGADPERVNPRGGAIALGHPMGASGARLITTLLHELEDDDRELGLVTMCCGGGLGTATLIQRT